LVEAFYGGQPLPDLRAWLPAMGSSPEREWRGSRSKEGEGRQQSWRKGTPRHHGESCMRRDSVPVLLFTRLLCAFCCVAWGRIEGEGREEEKEEREGKKGEKIGKFSEIWKLTQRKIKVNLWSWYKNYFFKKMHNYNLIKHRCLSLIKLK
jgi:hypothetical protein